MRSCHRAERRGVEGLEKLGVRSRRRECRPGTSFASATIVVAVGGVEPAPLVPGFELGHSLALGGRRVAPALSVTSARSALVTLGEQRCDRVGVIEELPPVADGGDGRRDRGGDGKPSAWRSSRCRSCHSPLALLALLVGGPPAFEVLAQAIVVVGHRPEPLVAAEGEQRVEVGGIGRLGERRRAAGAGGEVLETLEQRRDLGALLAVLRRGSRQRSRVPCTASR